uniref:uncharacterized protein LOC120330184 n=1 Tax=Styela clava TaxID=7725 RepID=UPI0019392755|nr:uncharacterized protein LOC120330184 [Styela clava]
MNQSKISIYICGAHCSGKTTLQQSLQKHPEFKRFHFKTQDEIARALMKRKGYTKEDLKNKHLYFKFEHDLLYLQTTAEHNEISECNGEYRRFLWDRGVIDPIVYMKEIIGEDEATKCMELQSVTEALKRWKCGKNVLIIVTKPDRTFLEEDDIRMDGDFESIMNIHESTINLLNDIGISHKVINELDLEKRTQIVVNEVKGKWPEFFL